MTRHPVFFDPTKRRSVILGYLGWTVSVVSTIVLVLFVASLLFLPSVPVLPLDPPHKRAAIAAANDIAQRRELLPAARRLADAARSTNAATKWQAVDDAEGDAPAAPGGARPHRQPAARDRLLRDMGRQQLRFARGGATQARLGGSELARADRARSRT